LAEVEIELEPATEAAAQHLADRVARAVQNALSFRAQVRTVPSGSLPRFEMKAKRFIRRTS
jgi:phenylacetate-CoA ligase